MESTLLNYCRENIEDFAIMESLALKAIDKMRCPLSMAFPPLYDAMSEAVENYCIDNDLENDFDIEDIFWAD